MELPEILALAQPSGGRFTTTIDDGWLQGRTAYGGVTAALAFEAARSLEDDLPPLRSAQIAFVGPSAGQLKAESRLLRKGRNATFIQTDLIGERGVVLTATFVFMAKIDSHIELSDMPMPDVASPEDSKKRELSVGPAFLDRFEWRFGLPRPEEPKGDISAWIRLNGREGLDPVSELLAIGDANPPAAALLSKKQVPLSSINWTVNLLHPQPSTEDGWYFLRSTALHAKDGGSSQTMWLWNRNGEPIAHAMQSVALFG